MAEEDGMACLGQAIATGKAGFAETLDMLTSAHIRLFGNPGTPAGLYALERRITDRLIDVVEKAHLKLNTQIQETSRGNWISRAIDYVRGSDGVER